MSSRILGLGIDVVDLSRIAGILERRGERFVARLCRPGEWQRRRGDAFVQHVGGLFAAKEAVLKALGTGWAQGLNFRQVEILRISSGAPQAVLHAAAESRAAAMGVERVHLSITHEQSYAAAVAILEGDPL